MGWLPGHYKYRKAFTIDKTKIGSGTHSLFTAYVPIADDAGFGAHAKADGTDVCWTKADGTTLLNFQRRAFAVDGGLATGSWEVLLADDISSAANPLVYAYYGDADAADLSDADGAWNSNVVGAWYLGEAAGTGAGNYKDASAYGNHGTLTDADADTTSVEGKIGNCVDFAGDADYINCGSGASLDNLTERTIEVWGVPDTSGPSTYGRWVGKGDPNGWYLWTNYDILLYGFSQAFADGTNYWRFTSAATGWRHIAITYAGSPTGGLVAYVNGEACDVEKVGTAVGAQVDDSAGSLILGNRVAGDRAFDGKIDEARVHNVIRSAGWILTRYNNESSPGTFVTAGAEEAFVRIPQYYHRMKVR